MKDKIKIIKGKIEITIECEPGTMKVSLPPAESIKFKEYLYPHPAYRIPHNKFSIDGEMKSITLTKKTKKKE